MARVGAKYRLTRRESEILHLLLQGRSSKSVALRLQTSSRTVEKHRQNIMAKFGAHSLRSMIAKLIPYT